jgi:hypothetical protein
MRWLAGISLLVLAIKIEGGWTNQFPNLFSLAHGNGVWVASGYTIQTSKDGTNWVETFSWTAHITSMAFGNGRFVGWVGDTAFISTNGFDWRTQKLFAMDGSYTVGDVCFGSNQTFVVVSNGGIYQSADGEDWSFRNPTICKSVAGTTEGFVAVQIDGALLKSADGRSWDWVNAQAAHKFWNVTAADNKFWAAGENGQLSSSVDGVTWVAAETGTTEPIFYESITKHGDELLFSNAKGEIFMSRDGAKWERKSTIGEQGRILSANGVVQAVGLRGAHFYSTDAVNWNSARAGDPPASQTTEVTFGKGKFVVAMGDAVFVSTNAQVWSRVPLGLEGVSISGIVYGEEKFIGVGNSATGAVTLVSEDAVQWRRGEEISRNRLKRVRHLNGKFIALGDVGLVAISGDGVAWTKVYDGHWVSWNEVTYGNGRYVLAGTPLIRVIFDLGDDTAPHSPIAVSTNLLNWAPGPATLDAFTDVDFLDGRFVALKGESEEGYFVSSDGLNWARESFPADGPSGINWQWARMNGREIIFGRGAIWDKKPGEGWVQHKTDIYTSLGVLAAGNGVYVAVGTGGKILTTRAGAPEIRMRPASVNGAFVIEGAEGFPYSIQSSTDLRTWMPWLQILEPAPAQAVTVPVSTEADQRFFRVEIQ